MRFLFFLLLFFILLALPAKAILPYSLYLKGRQVFGSEVRLGDLGRIVNAKDARALSQKLVARNLRRPVYLKASKLRALLKNATPERLDKVYGNGIWLIPQNKTLDTKQIEAILMQQMALLPGSDNLQKRLEIRVNKGSVIKIPSEGVELKFRLPAHARSLTPGKRILALDVFATSPEPRKKNGMANTPNERQESPSLKTVGKASPKTFLLRKNVRIEIRRWVNVGVALRDLPIGHRLTNTDFRMERRAVFGSRRDYELGQSLVGLRAVRRIHAGEDLSIRNVQRLPAVRRGQSVKLVYQTPGLVLRIQSVALRDAETGEELRVRVVLPGGRYGKTLRARVADNGVVVAQ